jgi:predicted RNA-binding protein YlxR (DUF448 family)
VKKHIPNRTCIACHQVKPKRELIRLVRLADGKVDIDFSGRKNGRGTYLCHSNNCWQLGLKGNRLEYALKTVISSQNRVQLMSYSNEIES